MTGGQAPPNPPLLPATGIPRHAWDRTIWREQYAAQVVAQTRRDREERGLPEHVEVVVR